MRKKKLLFHCITKKTAIIDCGLKNVICSLHDDAPESTISYNLFSPLEIHEISLLLDLHELTQWWIETTESNWSEPAECFQFIDVIKTESIIKSHEKEKTVISL